MNREQLLFELVAADGAILFWQLPKDAVADAILSGVARLADDDCLVHRDAFRIADSGYSMQRSDGVTAIAEAFAEVMRQWLSKEEFAEMKRLNQTPAYADGCCASHNYCDANMAMASAFKDVMGRDIDFDSEDAAAIWNEAWDLARKLYMGHAT